MFNPSQVFDLAKKAIERAMSLTEEEGKALLGKLPLEKLGQRTTTELEKVVSGLVTKLLSGLDEPVDETVRAEVVKMIVEMNTTPRNVVSHLRYVNDLFQATAPKNLADLKKIHSTIAQRLVEDAKARLAAQSGTAAGETSGTEVSQQVAAPATKKKSSKATEKHAE